MPLFYRPNEKASCLRNNVECSFFPPRRCCTGFTPKDAASTCRPIHGGTLACDPRHRTGAAVTKRRHSQLTEATPTGRLAVTGKRRIEPRPHRLSMLFGSIGRKPISPIVFPPSASVKLQESSNASTDHLRLPTSCTNSAAVWIVFRSSTCCGSPACRTRRKLRRQRRIQRGP